MSRFPVLLYGVISYFLFFGTFLYAIFFVFTLSPVRPPFLTMAEERPTAPLLEALLINGAFLTLFAVQHSIMARQWFKRWWTKIIPPAIERSTYVLVTSLILLGMITYWRAVPTIIWQVDDPMAATFLMGLSGIGFLIVLVATFLIDHFDLFGLRQVWDHWNGRALQSPRFQTPMFYKMTRHPLYLGFIIAFWATPVMTLDHLFFAVMTSGYMLVAIQIEEKDLMSFHPGAYAEYKKKVPMLFPWRGKALN